MGRFEVEPMSKAYLDPGRAKPCAIAILENDGSLAELCWLRGTELTSHAGHWHTPITDLLWEKPQVYPHSKVNPNQIVDDAICAALAVDYLQRCMPAMRVRSVAPRAWKGTIKKPPHHLRLWGILSPEERELLGGAKTEGYIRAAAERLATAGEVSGYSGEAVDLLDAVAMGKYDFGLLPGPIAGRVQPRRKGRYGARKPR